jgi:hypothetical protein
MWVCKGGAKAVVPKKETRSLLTGTYFASGRRVSAAYPLATTAAVVPAVTANPGKNGDDTTTVRLLRFLLLVTHCDS